MIDISRDITDRLKPGGDLKWSADGMRLESTLK